LLNNRLNEARLLIDSDTIEKTITNNLIEEVDKEFNQCKKYNYFGDKSEKQIKDLINDIKDKYKGKFNKEKNQNGEKENINSKKQDNSIKNDSDINSKEEVATPKDVKEAKDTKETSTETTEKIYHVTSSSNEGGAISPKGNQSIKSGTDMTFTITPDNGYHL
jgi:hypothetical protein